MAPVDEELINLMNMYGSTSPGAAPPPSGDTLPASPVAAGATTGVPGRDPFGPTAVLDHTVDGYPFYRPLEPGEVAPSTQVPYSEAGAAPGGVFGPGEAPSPPPEPQIAQAAVSGAAPGGPQPGEAPQAPQAAPPGTDPALLDIIREFGGEGAVEAYQNPPPTEQPSGLGQYAASFVDRLAQRLDQGVGVSPIGQVQKAIEAVGKMVVRNPERLEEFLQKGQMQRIFGDLMQKAGFPPADVSTFMGELGGDQADSLIMLAALRGVAPYLQGLGTPAKTFAGRGRRFLAKLGEATVRHPWLGAATDIFGSTPGGVYFKREARETVPGSTTAEVGAGMLGALAGGALVGRTLKTVGNFAKRAATPTLPTHGAPIVDEYGLPMSARIFSEQQYEGDLLRIENNIMRSVNSLRRPPGTASQLQTEVHKGLQRAEEVAEGVERRYWRRVTNLRRGVSSNTILPELERMENQWRGRFAQSEIPDGHIQGIKDLWEDLGTGATKAPTIERLRAEIRDMRRAIRDEQGKVVSGRTPNNILIANYNQLITLVNDTIAQTIPGDIPLQQAIAMSREVNSLFGSGIVARLLATKRTGEAAVRPIHTVEEMLSRTDGLEDVLRVSRRMRTSAAWRDLGATGPIRARPSLLSPPELAALRQMEGDIGNTIRAQYHEAVDAARQAGEIDPSKVRTLLRKMEPEIRSLSAIGSRMRLIGDRLYSILEERSVLEKSALAKFSQMDPDKAIQSIISNRDPATMARSLVQGRPATPGAPALPGLGSDANALSGLKNGLMIHMTYANSKGGVVDAVRFQQYTHRADIRRMIQEVWTPAEVTRLDRMTDLAARMARGEVKTVGQRFEPVARLIAGVFGAGVGSRVSGMIGTGNIQTPAFFANYWRNMATSWLARFDPNMMLARAMTDPAFEKLLLKHEPLNTVEAETFLRSIVNLTSGAEATRQGAQTIWEREMRKEPPDDDWAAAAGRQQLALTQPGEMNPDQEPVPTQRDFNRIEMERQRRENISPMRDFEPQPPEAPPPQPGNRLANSELSPFARSVRTAMDEYAAENARRSATPWGQVMGAASTALGLIGPGRGGGGGGPFRTPQGAATYTTRDVGVMSPPSRVARGFGSPEQLKNIGTRFDYEVDKKITSLRPSAWNPANENFDKNAAGTWFRTPSFEFILDANGRPNASILLKAPEGAPAKFMVQFYDPNVARMGMEQGRQPADAMVGDPVFFDNAQIAKTFVNHALAYKGPEFLQNYTRLKWEYTGMDRRSVNNKGPRLVVDNPPQEPQAGHTPTEGQRDLQRQQKGSPFRGPAAGPTYTTSDVGVSSPMTRAVRDFTPQGAATYTPKETGAMSPAARVPVERELPARNPPERRGWGSREVKGEAWTEAEFNALKEYSDAGGRRGTGKTITELFPNRSETAIRHRAEKWGISLGEPRGRPRVLSDPAKRAAVEELIAQKAPMTEVGKVLGIDKGRARELLKREGMLPDYVEPQRVVPADKVQYAHEQMALGKTKRELAKELDIPPSTVGTVIDKFRMRKIKTMMEQGFSMRQIVDKINLPETSVQNYIERLQRNFTNLPVPDAIREPGIPEVTIQRQPQPLEPADPFSKALERNPGASIFDLAKEPRRPANENVNIYDEFPSRGGDIIRGKRQDPSKVKPPEPPKGKK